jgi:hypothetical protein
MKMSPSLTAGQIVKFTDLQTAALRKSGLPVKETQQVLETHGGTLADEFVALVRTRVDAISDLISRLVSVKRNRTPQQALDATKRVQYTTASVVNSMPKGEGDKVEVVFFKVGHYVSDTDLEKEYELRGLKPADPYSLAAANEADPTFADEHPNGTHWKDADGKWCFAAFRRWVGERSVGVGRRVSDWSDDWWFAGFRK